MIKQITQIIVLIVFCTSSLTFTMEPGISDEMTGRPAPNNPREIENIKPINIESLQTLAMKAVLKNPRQLITQRLPPQCAVMAHGKLIDIKPLIFSFNRIEDPVAGHYPCRICRLSSANNAVRHHKIGFSQDSESLLVEVLYEVNDFSHFHRWDTAHNEWKKYNLDEISFEKSIDIYVDGRANDKASVEKQFQIYTEPYCIPYPEKPLFITLNQNKNKLIICCYSNNRGHEITLYNLDDDFNLPQLCLLSAIQQEQKQGKKLELTKTEQAIFDSLQPETQITVQDFVIPYPS